MSDRDDQAIAIVGMAARFAGARDLHAYWRMTVEGRDGFGPVPPDRWDHDAFHDDDKRAADKSYAPRGGFLDDVRTFPAVALQVPPRRVEVMDPQQRLALELGLQAADDAGYAPGSLPARTGVYMGVTALEYRTLMTSRVVAQLMASGALGEAPDDPDAVARAVERVVPTRPYSAPGMLANMIAATVAQEMRLRGPAFTADAACASSLVTVADAVNGLRAGSIDAALAGGVYLSLTPEHHVAFSRIGAMSERGECRPFDERADGFVQGDGGGVVLLERLSDARRRGDRVYAVLRGIGLNNDGGGEGPMAPVGSGQAEVIRRAWDDAGLDPARLGYLETHGTATSVGDRTEIDALRDVLGEERTPVTLGSSKANVGHTMSAAGVAGLIRATLAVHHGRLPPMAGFASPKPELDLERSPFRVPTEPEPWTRDDRVAAVSSFGFGGTNAHAIVEAPDERAAPPPEQPELVPMSAPDEETLRDLAARTAEAVAEEPTATPAGLARAWARRRRQAARLGVVASTRDELVERLRAVGRGEQPAGTALGHAEQSPRVAFLFPGQGAQRVGMLAGIRDRFPVVAEALAEMDEALAGDLDRPVTHLLYPERRAEPVDDATAAAELTATEHCQPALFAAGVALQRLLDRVGVRPDVVAGHSVGEFTAAAAGGAVPVGDAARFVARRGRAMAAMTGDRGAMVAIGTGADEARELLVDGAVVANVNHPRQVVVSGFSGAVEEVARRAEEKGLKTSRLEVSHGFHSPVFEALDLSAHVEALPFRDPDVPVASGIVPRAYRDAGDARGAFHAHATSPVDWTGALRACREAGANVLVQVGAGGPLASMSRSALRGEPVEVLGLASADDGDEGASLLEGLAGLWVRGVEVDVEAVAAPARLVSAPPVVLPRETYWGIRDRPVGSLKLAGPSSDAAESREATAERRPAEASRRAEPDEAADDGVAERVMAAVAKVSAYPRRALERSMRLDDDLGFDSMMVSDLSEELTRSVPGLSGIPQELLVEQPTVGGLVDYVTDVARHGGEGVADDDAPLSRYRPAWRPAPHPPTGWRDTPPGLRVLVTGPDTDRLEPCARALSERGARVTATGPDSASEASGPVDLVLYGCAEAPPPVHAVLGGEAEPPDPGGELAEVLVRQAQLGASPELLVAAPDGDPWSEGPAAIARTRAREQPERVARAVRLDPDLEPVEVGERLVEELRSPDRSVDVRHGPEERQVLGLEPLDGDRGAPPAFEASDDEVVLVTGGTRGIGTMLGRALADRGALVLLAGRGEPAAEAAELAAEHDGRVRTLRADVTDAEALRAALAEQPPVTTLVHAAGLLADGPLDEVDRERGRLARDVKVRGWLNALAVCGDSLRVALGLGSWAGRFGNRHQADYAAGNAVMAALADHGPERVRTVVAELGPWSSSAMVASIPEAVQASMRAEGVDFVGDEAGVQALLEDLGDGAGTVVRGRQLPATTQRVTMGETLSTATHPYLADHAVASTSHTPPTSPVHRRGSGIPLLPLASAAEMVVRASAEEPPFELRDLTLHRGVTVTEPTAVRAVVDGARAELRVGEGEADGEAVAYRATLHTPNEAAAYGDEGPAPVSADEVPAESLEAFYEQAAFHGPRMRALEAVDAIADDAVRGRVRTGRPVDWVPDTPLERWTLDPLALDGAMQLSAFLAWSRFGRVGTPVGIGRYVQLRPLPPAASVLAEARLEWATEGSGGDPAARTGAAGGVWDVDPAARTGTAGGVWDVDPAARTGAAGGVWDVDEQRLSGTLALRDEEGALLAWAERVVARVQPLEGAAGPREQPDDDAEPLEIPREWVDPAAWPEYRQLRARFEGLEALGLDNPYFDLHEGTARNRSVVDGREVLNYSSYNYLGLSGDERIRADVAEAMATWGTSVSASRVASGERPFHRTLERELAAAHGVDDAIVFPSGHATNVATIGHLLGPDDLILHDELIHDSCLQGTKLSGAARQWFRHDDPEHLAERLRALRRHYEKVLVLIEGAYSMDGDVAQLPRYVELKERWGCLLMVDEAHSFGTVGRTGHGVREHFGVDARRVDVWMGTLSKALAAMGGWIAGSAALVEYLRYTTPGFVFAAGLAPTVGQSALSALRLMHAEPWRVEQLQQRSRRFLEACRERGLDTGAAAGVSPVVPVITGDSTQALQLSARLLDEHGINAKPIVYPAVAEDAARLRFFVTSLHTPEELDRTAACTAETLSAIRGEGGPARSP